MDGVEALKLGCAIVAAVGAVVGGVVGLVVLVLHRQLGPLVEQVAKVDKAVSVELAALGARVDEHGRRLVHVEERVEKLHPAATPH